MRKNNQQLRFQEIDRRLRLFPPPTFDELAQLPICSSYDEKTIRRDLKDLRDYGAPIGTQRKGNLVNYYYEDPGWKLERLTVSATDMLYLTLARQAVSQFSNSLMARKVNHLLDQLQQEVADESSFSREEIEQAVSFDPPPTQPVDTSIWNMLLYATLKKEAVEILYKPGGSAKPSWRVIYPYHMVCLEGDWFLLVGAPGKPRPRQYNLARVHEVKPGKETFRLPEDFDPKAILDSTFGRFISLGKKELVRIQVTGFMRRYVEQRNWHAQQVVTPIDEDTIEISFPASSDGPAPFGNVASWILSLGPCARVLAPDSLREQVLREAHNVIDNYR